MMAGLRERISAAALAMGGLALAAPAHAAGFGEVADVQVSWWRVIGSLLLCILIALGAAYALKARMQGGAALAGLKLWPPSFGHAIKLLAPQSRRLKLIETLRLSHQVDVCLIDCDGVEVALAASPHGAVMLFTRPRAGTEPDIGEKPS